jgi:GNAT superfamily N-acetyltransferase
VAAYDPRVTIQYDWRGAFENDEVNRLHAEAFGTPVFASDDRDWRAQVARHSLGWVAARDGGALVGFVNVPWDGLVHAWIQDTMVAVHARGRGIGTQLVARAAEAARAAGCEWLHVDLADDLRDFYFAACGFQPTAAGVMQLQPSRDSP